MVIRIRVARLIALIALLAQALSTHVPPAAVAQSLSAAVPEATSTAPSLSTITPPATIASTGTSTSTILSTATATSTTTASSLPLTTPTVSITATDVTSSTATRIPMPTPTASITPTASVTITSMGTNTSTVSSTGTAIITATASVTPTETVGITATVGTTQSSLTAGLSRSNFHVKRLLVRTTQTSTAAGQSFTFLQQPFTQELYGTASVSNLLGGVAFAPNGDVWADNCWYGGSPLYRFAKGSTYQQNATSLHTSTIVPSAAGCGLTNHPDGYLYSNTSRGVTKLDANTGAFLATLGSPGNALGITVDPQTNDLVYVGANCAILRLNPSTGVSSIFTTLYAANACGTDGIAFDPTGSYLLLSVPEWGVGVLDRRGALVQQIFLSNRPDGISVHSTTPLFVVTNNNDGSITRLDFPNNDLTRAPTQTIFASGGFRGDQSQVGADGCIYLTQNGTRFNDGTASYSNSIVRICPGFAPSPGVASPSAGIIPWHPHRTFRLSPNLAAAVDLADGHVDVSASDMSIPGRGPDLTLGHTWDSLLASSGVTTTEAGWVDSLTPSMGGVLTATVTFTDATGASWPFRYTGTLTQTSPYMSYTSPPGMPWQLTTTSAGYTLTNILTGATRTFNQQGQWSRDTDSYGNSNTLAPGPLSAGYKGARPPVEKNSGGRSLSFHYDGQNRLDHVYSPLWRGSGGAQGQHVSYGYTSGQLTTVTWGAETTDALTATFGYSGSLLTSITTPYTQAAHTWTINYNDQGQVTSIVSPPRDGDTSGTPTDATVFFYNTDASGSQVVDGANTTSPLTTTYTVDAQGEPITITDGLDHNTFYTYDADHDVLTATDANNHTTTNDYAYVGPNGSIGLITKTVQPAVQPDSSIDAPAAPTTQYAYDPATHDRTKTFMPNGGIILNTYDAHHSLIATMQAVDHPNGDITLTSWRGTITGYDQYGERVSTTDGRGVIVSPNPTGINHLPTGVQLGPNATSYTHAYSYTSQGDLSQERTPPIVTTLGATTSTASVTTSYMSDGDGNQIGVTSANGNTTTTEYDHLGRTVRTTLPMVTLWDGTAVAPSSVTGYDAEGNVVRQVDANGAATLSNYDPLGREIRMTNPVSGTTVITYNATEKVAEQDPQGNVTRYAYDGAGRLRQEIDPTGSVTQDEYDPVGNTTAITTGDKNTVIQVDTRQYDALNRVMTATVSGPTTAAQETLTWYDLDGNRAMVQNPNGDSTVYNYDLADQLVNVNITDVTASTATNAQKYEQYSYDAAGNQVQAQDGDGRTTTTTLDGASRVIQTVDMTGTTTITTTQQYDPNGNVVQTTRLTREGSGPIQQQIEAMTVNAADWTTTSTDGGLTTAYGYDAAGQERSRTILNGAAPITTTLDAEGRATAISEALNSKTPYMSLYGYNPNDLPITATLPNGTGTSWTYDGDSRVTGLVLSGPSAVTAPLSTTYSYGYDAASQTTAITNVVNGTITAQTLAHNAQGYLTGVSGAGATQSLGYDGNGNINTSSIGGQTTAYHYDAQQPNQLDTLTSPSGTTGYHYDKNGDTVGITSTAGISTGVSYDAQARLTTVTLADGTTVNVRYNAVGQRAEYTVSKNGVTSVDERYGYRAGELGQVVTVSGTVTTTDTYIYAPNGSPLELIRQQNGELSRYWYHTDKLGSVVALTDSGGNVVNRYSYDVWGTPVATSESVPQRLRYAGYWWDSELNWYWVSVRSYDPVLKRWLQPDPSQQDGVRTYVYVGDDPVDENDPSGLSALNAYGPPSLPTPPPTSPPPTLTPGPNGSSCGCFAYVNPTQTHAVAIMLHEEAIDWLGAIGIGVGTGKASDWAVTHHFRVPQRITKRMWRGAGSIRRALYRAKVPLPEETRGAGTRTTVSAIVVTAIIQRRSIDQDKLAWWLHEHERTGFYLSGGTKPLDPSSQCIGPSYLTITTVRDSSTPVLPDDLVPIWNDNGGPEPGYIHEAPYE